MNATNVKASLTTAVNNLVTSNDITTAPRNIPLLVGQMANLIAAEEANAAQHAKDVTTANGISKLTPKA